MKLRVPLLLLLLVLTTTSFAQNIETMYGLYLGESRTSVEKYLQEESDWELVRNHPNQLGYQIKKGSKISLKFKNGLLYQVFALYPLEEKKYQMDKLAERYGTPHEASPSVSDPYTQNFFWNFDGWLLTFVVYPDESSAIVFDSNVKR